MIEERVFCITEEQWAQALRSLLRTRIERRFHGMKGCEIARSGDGQPVTRCPFGYWDSCPSYLEEADDRASLLEFDLSEIVRVALRDFEVVEVISAVWQSFCPVRFHDSDGSYRVTVLVREKEE